MLKEKHVFWGWVVLFVINLGFGVWNALAGSFWWATANTALAATLVWLIYRGRAQGLHKSDDSLI